MSELAEGQDPRARQRQIRDALHAVLEEQRDDEVAARSRRRRVSGKWVVPMLVCAWVAIAAAWIARPPLLFGPRTSAATELTDARARYKLYLTRARIEEYSRRYGRLPATLSETQHADALIQYAPVADNYTISLPVGGRVVQLSRRMNADSFLGRSLDALRAGQ